MAKTKEEMLRAAKTKSIEAWLENHPANCSFTLYENSDGSISCSDSHDISAAKAYESDLRAELARRAAPKVEPPAPREPKAGEVWRGALEMGKYFAMVGCDGDIFWLNNGAGLSSIEANAIVELGFTFYAATFDEAVRRRAAEMGLGANEGLAVGDLDSIVEELESHGFEKSGSAVEDRHFILGAIRELVAARDGNSDSLLRISRDNWKKWHDEEEARANAAVAEADALRRRLAEAEAAKTDQWWDGLCAYLRDASVLPSHVKRAGMATIIEAIGGVLAENLALESRVQAAEEKISSVRIALDPTLPADDES